MAKEVLNRYDSFIGSFVPWKEFKQSLDALEKYQNDYSTELDLQVATIKLDIMNGIDDYFQASQKVREFAGIIESQLKLFIKLFDGHDAKKAESQKELFIKVLDEGAAQINETQVQLGNSSLNLVAAREVISASHLEFFEKWKIYYNELKKPAPTLQEFIWKNEKYLIDNMKKFRAIINICMDFHAKLVRATQSVARAREILRAQMTAIDDLKEQIQQTYSTSFGDESPNLRDQIIKSAQHLIEDSQKYRQKHAKTDLYWQ